jgi:hypothetical protein
MEWVKGMDNGEWVKGKESALRLFSFVFVVRFRRWFGTKVTNGNSRLFRLFYSWFFDDPLVAGFKPLPLDNGTE